MVDNNVWHLGCTRRHFKDTGKPPSYLDLLEYFSRKSFPGNPYEILYVPFLSQDAWHRYLSDKPTRVTAHVLHRDGNQKPISGSPVEVLREYREIRGQYSKVVVVDTGFYMLSDAIRHIGDFYKEFEKARIQF